MDFSLSEQQIAIRDLTAQICADRCSTEELRLVAATDSGTDLGLWKQLAASGLVGIGLGEDVGGGGLGWIETCTVLAELARFAAPVPALATIGLAAPALASVPSIARQVITGDLVVVAAVHERAGDPLHPTATAVDGRLTGTKTCVLHGPVADAFVVTCTDGLFLVQRDEDGVSIELQYNATDAPDAHVTFDGAMADRLGGFEAVERLGRRGMSAASVMSAAACEAALALLASYAVEREQFDKPIAAFQAVSQRAADAYIDIEACRLTAWQAAWRLHEGLSADAELYTAKFWAAEGGWRAVHAALHIHGGVGVDRDYPLHRHFLLHKQLELHLGSATPSLAALGRLIASD